MTFPFTGPFDFDVDCAGALVTGVRSRRAARRVRMTILREGYCEEGGSWTGCGRREAGDRKQSSGVRVEVSNFELGQRNVLLARDGITEPRVPASGGFSFFLGWEIDQANTPVKCEYTYRSQT